MKTVLIVDDSRIFQKLIEQIMATKYKIVGKGASGVEGFDLYQKLKPDLVLMDIVMPNCNGKDCLRKILEFDPAARVIMVSSVGDEATVEECLRIGAKAFVVKSDISYTDSANSKLVNTANEILASQEKREAA